MRRVSCLAALCLLLLLAAEAPASTPTGIYVLVDEVVLEPNEAKPERILIRGVFMNEIDQGRKNPDSNVRNPKAGWMAFKLAPGKEELCRLEWKDLKAVAGKGQVVAFGSIDAPVLHESYTVAKAVQKDRPKGDPELVYPIGHGMYQLRPDSDPALKLKAARAP
jgi:hypothetical protein